MPFFPLIEARFVGRGSRETAVARDKKKEGVGMKQTTEVRIHMAGYGRVGYLEANQRSRRCQIRDSKCETPTALALFFGV